MKLIIVRHGETDKNLMPTHRGIDAPLNKTGRLQSESVARRLAKEKINIIYSSDLRRARQTTDAILSLQPNVKVVYTKELRERNSGKSASQSKNEKETAQKMSGQSVHDWRPEGGESLRDLKDRSGQWLDTHRTQDAEKTILIVSHGLFIYTLLACAIEEGAEIENELYQHRNAAVTILDVPEKGVVKVIHLNDTAHLEKSVGKLEKE